MVSNRMMPVRTTQVEIRDMFLIEFEVSKKKLIQILSILPEEFFHREKLISLRQSLASWYGFCQYHKLDPVQLLIKVPMILLFNHERFVERLDELKDYFGSKSEISDLVTNSPRVLLEDWSNLQNKLDFFIHEMQIFPGTLAKSQALSP